MREMNKTDDATDKTNGAIKRLCEIVADRVRRVTNTDDPKLDKLGDLIRWRT
jgi:hypothetical protein